jgi:hypothetical protein
MMTRKASLRAPARVLLAALALAAACSSRIDPPPLDPARRAELESWLAAHGKDPAEYVVGLFADHDVVFLGEVHHIRHEVHFVPSLFEPLYAAGVRTLATEFGRREDQARIDSLLAAPAWHEDLARAIVFDQYVWWGFQEYVDVYRGAWELNRKLPAGSPPFRILGVNDSPDWSHIQKPEDRDDGAIMAKVWRGGGEEHWARVILERVAVGEKVLVYSGMHHAFSEYRQPIVAGGEFKRFDDSRMGNHVFRALGKRAVTIFMHAPWNGPAGYDAAVVHPADGVIDALMLEREGGPRAAGFDLSGGSPFGALAVRNCVYRHGYPDFRLADFADGWIYWKPVSECEGVTPIQGWITRENLERARLQTPNPRSRDLSVEEFNAAIARTAGHRHPFGRLR